MKDGYSICFNEWALDKDIKSELGLLLIISSLCAEKGYCYANNTYLANLFDIDEVSISRKLKKLENKNYIIIDYKMNGNVIISREIRLTKMLTAINKNVKDNIINNKNKKNTIINNSIKKSNSKRFKKPTLEEVQEYCKERNNNIDAEQFINYYESNGWKVGKSSMKDWKACVRTWERNNFNKNNNKEERKLYQDEDGAFHF